jgi:hypothetical protein
MLTAAAAGVCVRCDQKRYGLSERGLCYSCRRQGGSKAPPLAPRPTSYLPGTVEKIELMRWRAERGFAVLHPLDQTEDSRPNGPSRYRGFGYDGELRIHRFAKTG